MQSEYKHLHILLNMIYFAKLWSNDVRMSDNVGMIFL